MAENQNTTSDSKDAWLDGLDEQIEHASPEFLKAALEHTTKMLDHIYAANDSISQKARWGIGVIMGVIVIGLKAGFDANAVMGSTIQIPCSFLIALAGLLVAMGCVLYVAFTKTHHHSGMEPFRYKLDELIEFANSKKEEIPNAPTGKANLETA